MMRAKMKVSGSKPGALVQLGVSMTCGAVSRAVRTVSWFTNWPPSVRTIGPVSGPKRPPFRNWATARVVSEIATKPNATRCLDVPTRASESNWETLSEDEEFGYADPIGGNREPQGAQR